MRNKIAFIINPISGTRNKKDLPAFINSLIDPVKWETPLILYTERAGHGMELAQQCAADGFDVVVACGGDGTVNEIATGLIGTQTALSIVPYGSGNGLARHWGFSLTPRKAVAQINAGTSHPMDYGVVNDRKFFCTCGTGFDAHITHMYAKKGTRGFLTYLKCIVPEYFKYKPYEYQLEVNGETISRNAFVVTFANASQYGNDGFIAPHASTQDGLMDICFLDEFPMSSMPKLAWQLLHKTLDRSPYTTYFRSREAILRRSYEGEFHVDGEAILLGKEIHVEIISDQLKIWI